MAVSADGHWAASSHDDHAVRLWNLQTGRLEHILVGHTKQVNALAFTHTSNLLATGDSDGALFLWDTEKGDLRGRLSWSKPEESRVGLSSIAFSPVDSRLALGLHSGRLVVYDINLRRTCWESSPAEFTWGGAVAFSPNGQLIAIARSPKVCLFDALSGREELAFRNTGTVSFSFSPDGSILATGEEGFDVRLWNTRTGELIRRIRVEGLAGEGVEAVFSPDGRKLLVGGHYANELLLYDAKSGLVEQRMQGHQGALRSVAFMPDGISGLSAAADGSLRLWHMKDGRLLATIWLLPASNVSSPSCDWINFTPDGNWTASPDAEKFIRRPNGGEFLPNP
jgi:WD40 repeat protein